MYISKSPMRITFIGGGTDYESFFGKHQGFSIFATIDKFVYVSTIEQPSFVEDLYKFTYRKTESVGNINEIEHPVVREVLKEFKWNTPINIATMADLPESSGLGSSSAFTAAFYQNLAARKGVGLDSTSLAQKAISIERHRLNEPGGWQDQISTTFGGLRLISFSKKKFNVSDDLLGKQLIEYLKPRLILIRTSLIRKDMGSALLTEKFVREKKNISDLSRIATYSQNAWQKITRTDSPEVIFKILQDIIQTSWNYKSKWGNQILSAEVKSVISKIEKRGATAYKLVGAGGGGFLLVADTPLIISKIKHDFSQKDYIEFELYSQGTNTMIYE
jgi:D-glycero-alpha-D-manno-heptose-7-phosphate kinase